MEEFGLLIQDVNLDITEYQKSAHQKWTENQKWTAVIGKYK